MAATNPMRVSDLIAKYGWQIMPYLSNLGPTLLAEAQVLFVDSGATEASDADDGVHGHSMKTPLATIDYAIGLCTAAERSVILVAPGHNESLADAQIDFDISDVTCIGIGEGTNKPRIDFDHANSSVNIGANNVHLVNLTFMPSITDILVGVDVEAAVTGTILEKCDFAEGESADDEFIIGVDIKAGCSNTKITNCLFRTKAAAAGCTHAVKLTGASDNVIIEKSRMIGNYSTAAIGGITTLSTDVLIDDVTIKVLDGEPGIEMLTGTTGIIRNTCIESTGLAVDAMIVADTMSWFSNQGVTADGSSAEIIGSGETFTARIAANPNAAYGKEYWVDADTGSDSNDGLSPGAAFASIAAAITANNLVFAADSDPQNTMYIHSKTYTENLTTWPENCTMIGIGGKVRIQGYHTIYHTQNLRIHNIQFRSSQTAVPILDVTGNCHGLTLEGCVFDSSSTISECVKFTGSQSDVVIENCRLGYETAVANSPDIAIRFAGVHAQRSKVINNQIYSTGIGIQIDATMVSGCFLLIKDNVLAVGPGSSTDQMAVGIYDKTPAPSGGLYVNNFISAVDAIKFDVANSISVNLCIGNHVVQATTGGIETSGS